MVGKIVTYATKNPNSKTSRIGVVVSNEADIAGNVLVAEGAFTEQQAIDYDCQIISISPELLTEIAPSLVGTLTKQ